MFHRNEVILAAILESLHLEIPVLTLLHSSFTTNGDF